MCDSTAAFANEISKIKLNYLTNENDGTHIFTNICVRLQWFYQLADVYFHTLKLLKVVMRCMSSFAFCEPPNLLVLVCTVGSQVDP